MWGEISTWRHQKPNATFLWLMAKKQISLLCFVLTYSQQEYQVSSFYDPRSKNLHVFEALQQNIICHKRHASIFGKDVKISIPPLQVFHIESYHVSILDPYLLHYLKQSLGKHCAFSSKTNLGSLLWTLDDSKSSSASTTLPHWKLTLVNLDSIRVAAF